LVGVEPVVEWMRELPAPVRAAYEAGPTGFGLARVACAAGIDVRVAAPSKTPRAAGERVKTDRKDAELLARLPGHALRMYARHPSRSGATVLLCRSGSRLRATRCSGAVWPSGSRLIPATSC